MPDVRCGCNNNAWCNASSCTAGKDVAGPKNTHDVVGKVIGAAGSTVTLVLARFGTDPAPQSPRPTEIAPATATAAVDALAAAAPDATASKQRRRSSSPVGGLLRGIFGIGSSSAETAASLPKQADLATPAAARSGGGHHKGSPTSITCTIIKRTKGGLGLGLSHTDGVGEVVSSCTPGSPAHQAREYTRRPYT